MAVLDERSKADAWEGGSDRLAIGLTDAQAQEAYDDPSKVGGWLILSYQVESSYGPSRDSDTVRSENDVLIKQRVNRDEFNIITEFFRTDADLLRVLKWLEDAENAVPVRYPVPTDDPLVSQWVLLYNANVLIEDWRIAAQNQEGRTRSVTFVGSKDSQGRVSVIADLPNDTTDPAWAAYPEFIDSALP
jgi:hypothetical protein